MRLAERRLEEVRIAPRIREEGDLGGIAERFSNETIALRASRLPVEGALDVQERGAVCRKRIRLLVPSDADVRCGDGVWAGGTLYRVLCVEKWTAHLELVCEAV